MLVDVHAHLDKYGDELPSVLVQIADHRILTVSNSMDLPSYARNLKIARGCELVLATFGVHPWNASQYADRLDELAEAIEQSPMLGEIGLDYCFVQDKSQYDAQQKVLEFFLAAARDQDKIVNLHTKGAEDQVLRLLDRYEIRRAIIHWYSGPLDTLRELVDRGFYLTVGVQLLHADDIRAIAREIPPDRILTETDNPGGHQWLTGAPGMPRLIGQIVRELAAVRQTTTESLASAIEANVLRLIGDDTRLSGIRRTIGRAPS